MYQSRQASKGIFILIFQFILIASSKDIKGQNNAIRYHTSTLYTQAISDFVQTLKHQNAFLPDTIYFLKNIQFPDIVLPTKVQHHCIKLVENKEYDVILKKSPNSFSVNLMGFVNQNDAEFIFVGFRPGYQHQFDVFLEYKRNNSQNSYSLDQIFWQNFAKQKQSQKVLIFGSGKWLHE